MNIRILMAAIVLAACAAAPAMAQTPPPVGAVGGDSDAHGCLPSTGSTWSEVRRSCIQMWEAGVKLLPLKPQGTATFAAYVVFASGHDGRRAELFLYDRKESLILQKAGFWGHIWRGEGYTLTRQDGVWSLTDGQGNLVYRSNAAS